jgi:hypothetical protein
MSEWLTLLTWEQGVMRYRLRTRETDGGEWLVRVESEWPGYDWQQDYVSRARRPPDIHFPFDPDEMLAQVLEPLSDDERAEEAADD